ncbi:hypothetical protein H6F43_21485 [Leptolyngbya sp. FACHB-36]|uniref:hypothetical protein n=1 Tax=Leptolyngbya sp. FACHB-36 TaxID=2692808 RepID=UPI001680C32D|nr:hypothetical protein [Leptolyngbya sp. FACHB-36]MBD2022759.1 hypothetical protein [Leptolyngbya sp. FACHB-36]
MLPLVTRPLLLSMLIGLVGCNQSSPPPLSLSDANVVQWAVAPTPIADVQTATKQNATVHLKGRVGNRVPIVGASVYELQDSTGSIWVLSTQSPPNSGDEVFIKGTLRSQRLQQNNQTQDSVYVEQQEQLQRTPAVKS